MKSITKPCVLAASLALLSPAYPGFSEQASTPPARTQQQKKQSAKKKQTQHAICDRNRDGICDVCNRPVGSGRVNAKGKKAKKGKHWGPGDGSGNQGVGPRDGSGFGATSGKTKGAKDCTGAGNSQNKQSRAGKGKVRSGGGRGPCRR